MTPELHSTVGPWGIGDFSQADSTHHPSHRNPQHIDAIEESLAGPYFERSLHFILKIIATKTRFGGIFCCERLYFCRPPSRLQQQARFWTLVKTEFVFQKTVTGFRGCSFNSVFHHQRCWEKDVVCHSHTRDALQTFHPEPTTPSGCPSSPHRNLTAAPESSRVSRKRTLVYLGRE